jgi:hypothetical protein
MAGTIAQLRERLKTCNSGTETLLLGSTTFSLFWLAGSTDFYRTSFSPGLRFYFTILKSLLQI